MNVQTASSLAILGPRIPSAAAPRDQQVLSRINTPLGQKKNPAPPSTSVPRKNNIENGFVNRMPSERLDVNGDESLQAV